MAFCMEVMTQEKREIQVVISLLNHKEKLVFVILLFSIPCFGKVSPGKVSPGKISPSKITSIPAEEVKQIIVKAPNWILNFKAAKGPYKFDLQGPLAEKIFIESVEGTVKIASNNTSQKEEAVLNVTGPGAPLSLFALQGKIHISHWKHPVFIFSKDVKLEGYKNNGSWQFSSNNGKIKLNQFEGKLEARGFQLNMSLQNLKGKFLFHFNEGELKADKGAGKLAYVTDKGNIVIKNWQGNLTGESVSGSLRGISLQPNTVQAHSIKGMIAMSFINSRPLIDAFSEEGRIRAPKYMNKKYAGKSLAVKGRLRGNGRLEGKVSLKTERGNIYIQ